MNTTEYRRKYQREHREYFNISAKAFYSKNKIKINERRRHNPYSLFSTIKRNAKMRGLECLITKDLFKTWWSCQDQRCVYCDIPVERLAVTDLGKKLAKRLSIDRIDNDKGYIIGNLALACLRCNFIKSNLFSFQEMREIGQKYIKPKWQS